ncbi:MAG: hypothetical protein DWQ36_09260 [Acidobacteria bacterium]|nr:MAG: hypothetical protein DWQ30_22505 [Acidobacteriota bacterium]REK08548.1 MAG: hypothetical protein DWQ36_09260 [Acidobacteriota bacterium]
MGPPREAPRTVSPGHLERFSPVSGACPTFSWALVDSATHYEVEIYRVDEQWGEQVGEKVSSVRLQGTVGTWTPDADQCLEPGATYAWFVRAEVGGELTEWSRPRLLETALAPTLDEVRAAREVLARYLETQGFAAATDSSPGSAARRVAEAPADTASKRLTSKALDRQTESVAARRDRSEGGEAVQGLPPFASLAGSAAIRGQSSAVSGDANGVVGISSSPDGAGVVAAGAGIGVDLVLDGSTSGATDTTLSQDGLDRASASLESFSFRNSGGGGLDVDVAGSVSATSYFGDGSALTGVTVDDIECSGCVDRSDLALDSVSGSRVLNNSLTGSDIANFSLTASDLAAGSVDSSKIEAGAVTASKIASGAVGSSEITSDAVGRSELKSIRVVSVECNGTCAESTLGQICGGGYSAIAVDCDQIDDDSSSTTFGCGGDNVCSQHFVDDNDALSAFCWDEPGWDAQVYCLRD